MKRTFFVLGFVLLFGFSFNAYSANQGWYMGGNIGISRGKPIDLGSFTDAGSEELPVEDIPAGSAELGYNTGFVAGAAMGFDFGSYRVESEFAYQFNNFDDITLSYTIPGIGSYSNSTNVDGDASSYALLFNCYYDFLEDRTLSPFITAGIGMAYVDSEYSDDTAFAYQIGAGLSFKLNEKIIYDFRYRYFSASDIEVEYIGDVEYATHSVILNLRYYF